VLSGLSFEELFEFSNKEIFKKFMSLPRSSVYCNSGLIESAFSPKQLYLEVNYPTKQNNGIESNTNIDNSDNNSYNTPLNSLESEDLEVNGITKKNAFVNTNN